MDVTIDDLVESKDRILAEMNVLRKNLETFYEERNINYLGVTDERIPVKDFFNNCSLSSVVKAVIQMEALIK